MSDQAFTGNLQDQICKFTDNLQGQICNLQLIYKVRLGPLLQFTANLQGRYKVVVYVLKILTSLLINRKFTNNLQGQICNLQLIYRARFTIYC